MVHGLSLRKTTAKAKYRATPARLKAISLALVVPLLVSQWLISAVGFKAVMELILYEILLQLTLQFPRDNILQSGPCR